MIVRLYHHANRWSFHASPSLRSIAVQAPAGSELVTVRSFPEPLLLVPVGAGLRRAFEASDLAREAGQSGRFRVVGSDGGEAPAGPKRRRPIPFTSKF